MRFKRPIAGTIGRFNVGFGRIQNRAFLLKMSEINIFVINELVFLRAKSVSAFY